MCQQVNLAYKKNQINLSVRMLLLRQHSMVIIVSTCNLYYSYNEYFSIAILVQLLRCMSAQSGYLL